MLSTSKLLEIALILVGVVVGIAVLLPMRGDATGAARTMMDAGLYVLMVGGPVLLLLSVVRGR